MSKVKAIILVGFAVAFAAGLVVGLVARHAVLDGPRHRPSLVQELGLNSTQAEQVKQIWSGAMRNADEEEQRKLLRKERDDAVLALVPPQQKEAYEQIQQQYAGKMASLREQHGKAMQAAVERTKAILSEGQKQKYEELLKRWQGEGRGRGWRGEEHGASRPTTE